MRKKIFSTSALVIMIGAMFLAGSPRPSSAQDGGFEIYQLNVHCEDSSLVTKIFGHQATEGGTVGRPLMGTKVICAGKCGGEGPITLESALAGLPAGVSAGLKAQVDKHQCDAAAGNGSSLTCVNRHQPTEDKNAKCRKGGDSPSGKNCCDDVPERGSMYVGTLGGRMYSEPATNSTALGSPPSGTRLRYTRTTQVDGQTWYFIESPGRERQGWMPGNSLSCTRPMEPPVPKIIIPSSDGMQRFNGRAAHANAARG